LAVSDLQQPLPTWSFLVVHGLVRDDSGNQDQFFQFIQEEAALDITGPTVARRVALRLSDAGIALPASCVPDPWGKLAANRLALIEPWGEKAKQYLRDLQEMEGAREEREAESALGDRELSREQFDCIMGIYARPKLWHCIYCGWRCEEDFNDYLCKSCRQVRPFVGGSATVRQCQGCDQLSLAIASYCEWCGTQFN
jgi:hypothetical protein